MKSVDSNSFRKERGSIILSLICLLLAATGMADDLPLGFYSIFDSESSQVFDFEKKAEFKIWHRLGGEFEFTDLATKEVEKFERLPELARISHH